LIKSSMDLVAAGENANAYTDSNLLIVMTATNRVGPKSASESEINVLTVDQKNLVIVGATGMVGPDPAHPES
jgi:hypothetical protein